MDYYIDIRLIPDAEMPINRVINTVYAKLHKALCDLRSTDIGVSFPQRKILLGSVLRIHGSKARLGQLQEKDWLGGIVGYCVVGDIILVPAESQFRPVVRKQSNMSLAKLRRLTKRGSISEQEANQYRAKMFTKGLDNPYVELESGSNGHRHRRYIEFGELVDAPVEGEFDQFGLSKTATIPWF